MALKRNEIEARLKDEARVWFRHNDTGELFDATPELVAKYQQPLMRELYSPVTREDVASWLAGKDPFTAKAATERKPTERQQKFTPKDKGKEPEPDAPPAAPEPL